MSYPSVVEGRKGTMLSNALIPEFHKWVFIGGITLLVLTVIRAVVVWRAAGAHHHHHHEHGEACGHDHAHGADCGHHHHHHDHSHSHGHDHSHGGIYWRAVVLLFPVVLFFLGLPNQGYSDERIKLIAGNDAAIGAAGLADVQAKDGVVFDFAELGAAAYDPDKRESLAGRTATVKGRFKRISDKEFTLIHLKMTCCAADIVPLKARIVTDAALQGFRDMDWVEVSGRLQFVEVPGKNEYLPLIKALIKDVKPTKGE